VLLYVLLRAAIAWTAFHDVALPMYELYPMGTLAELLRRGVDVPLAWFYDNAAGQLLSGFLTVPAFAACGSSYLALKAVPAALGLATLVLLWRLLDRHVSRCAADLLALLFAVGPPALTKYSLVNSGNHFENLFFSTLALALAFRWFASARRSRAGLVAWSAAAGFAVFVFLGALLPVAILVAMHLGLRGPRRALGDLPWLAGGLGAGVLPLFAINALTGARGLGFLEAKFAGETSARGGDALARALDFLGPGFVHAGCFEPYGALSAPLLSGLFAAACAVAWTASLPAAWQAVRRLAQAELAPAQAARAREGVALLPFVLLPLAAALAYGVSNLRLGGHAPPIEMAGYRYHLPTLVAALVLVAARAARWLAGTGWRRAAGLALVGAAALPCASSIAVPDWSFSQAGLGARLAGFNLAQLARGLVSSRNAVPADEIVRRVREFPSDLREPVLVALGNNLGTQALERGLAAGPGPYDVGPELAPWPPEWHVAWLRGLGVALRADGRQRGRPLAETVALAASARWGDAPPAQAHVVVGTANPGVHLPLPWDTAAVLAPHDGALALAQREPAFGYGQGLLLGRLWARGVASDQAHVRRRLPVWVRQADALGLQFARGLGEGLAREDPRGTTLDELLGLVTPERRAEFWRGYGRGLCIAIDDPAAVDRAKIVSRADADGRRALQQGWLEARELAW
jgi:hypothetical protein